MATTGIRIKLLRHPCGPCTTTIRPWGPWRWVRPDRGPCDPSEPSPRSPSALSPWPWRAARADPTRQPHPSQPRSSGPCSPPCRPASTAAQPPAGHQPWLLSPELVATAYGAAELGLYQPVARRVGPNAYEVGATGSEWVARLYLAQPVRHGAGGVWVITRTASPARSYSGLAAGRRLLARRKPGVQIPSPPPPHTSRSGASPVHHRRRSRRSRDRLGPHWGPRPDRDPQGDGGVAKVVEAPRPSSAAEPGRRTRPHRNSYRLHGLTGQ